MSILSHWIKGKKLSKLLIQEYNKILEDILPANGRTINAVKPIEEDSKVEVVYTLTLSKEVENKFTITSERSGYSKIQMLLNSLKLYSICVNAIDQGDRIAIIDEENNVKTIFSDIIKPANEEEEQTWSRLLGNTNEE